MNFLAPAGFSYERPPVMPVKTGIQAVFWIPARRMPE
jgi:hypothetical protein